VVEEPQKDYLTGFFLRDTLYIFLKELISDAGLSKKCFSILLIDLDHFKKYNDKFGHLFGDEILEYVSDTFPLFFSKTNCFRYGGDEFVVILKDKDSKEAFRLAMDLKRHMNERPFLFEGKSYNDFKIGFSCGIASFPSDGHTAAELLKKADETMYFSKRHGRNLITIAGRMRYLKFRNTLLIFIGTCLIFVALSSLYLSPFKEPIRRIVQGLRGIRITAGEEDLDIVTLKNGNVLRGEILEETGQKLVLKIRLRGGAGSVILQKSEITDIKRITKK
jgi:diguanylate cyclase (GGDEF)-like protein